MRAIRAILVLFVFVAAFCGDRAPSVAAGGWYRVIVNPANPMDELDRRFLAEAFLKKSTRWPNDDLIRPVDLNPGSAVRRAFSDDVVKKSVSTVKSYWQQMVFSGRGVPPPEMDNEDEVVSFVLKNRGAVGYVSPATNLLGAKILPLR